MMGLGAGALDPISMGVSAGVNVASNLLNTWLASKKQNAQAKVFTTAKVNELEPMLNANKNAYLAGPGTCADQRAALAAFDNGMNWLESSAACGNPALGTPGANCIDDRLVTGKFPWPTWYRDPIQNDPRVLGCGVTVPTIPGTVAVGVVGSGVGLTDPFGLGMVGGIPMTYILVGVGAIVLIAIVA